MNRTASSYELCKRKFVAPKMIESPPTWFDGGFVPTDDDKTIVARIVGTADVFEMVALTHTLLDRWGPALKHRRTYRSRMAQTLYIGGVCEVCVNAPDWNARMIDQFWEQPHYFFENGFVPSPADREVIAAYGPGCDAKTCMAVVNTLMERWVAHFRRDLLVYPFLADFYSPYIMRFFSYRTVAEGMVAQE